MIAWSTPTRRQNGNLLTMIPNEIYCMIIELICADPTALPAETRKNLECVSQVCRFFSAVCLPKLFQERLFSSTRSGGVPSDQFCRELVQNKPLALTIAVFVEKCTLTGWSFALLKTNWVFRGFLQLYINVLPKLPNLHSLVLFDVSINEKTFVAISEMPALKSLEIELSTLSIDILKRNSHTFSLQLLAFSFHHTHIVDSSGEPTHLPCDIFQRLANTIQTPTLEILRTDSAALLEAFLPNKKTLSLRELSLTESSVYSNEDALIRFLDRTPTITALGLIADPRSVGAFERVAAGLGKTSLPSICSIECTSNILQHLAPGRPLKTIKILVNHGAITTTQKIDALKALQKSTSPIRVLHVPHNLFTLADIQLNFQQLELLQWDFACYGRKSTEYMLKMSSDFKESIRVQNVVHLAFITPYFNCADPLYWDLKAQHDIVCSVVKSFPSLTVMAITASAKESCGIIRQRGSMNAQISSYITANMRLETKQALFTTRHKVVDYNQCFESLFSPNEIDQAVRNRLGL